MKNIINKKGWFAGFIVAGTSIIFGGCINHTTEIEESVNHPTEGTTLRFFVEGIDTRTTTDEYNKGSLQTDHTVGIFGISPDGPIKNGTNNKYSVVSNGTLWTEEEMVAKERTERVDIFAYAPYNEQWNSHENNQNFSVSLDQSDEAGYLASDLLWATQTINNIQTDQEKIGLNFSHKLARIKVNLQESDYPFNLKAAIIKVNNTKINTTFNISTGKIGEVFGEAADIIAATLSENDREAYAIVIPQTIDKGTVLFTIKTTEKELTATLSKDIEIEAGKTYSFTINLPESDPEDVRLILDSNAKVTDWEDENIGSMDTDKEDNKNEEILIKEIDLNNITSFGNTCKWDNNNKKFSWWRKTSSDIDPGLLINPRNTDLTTAEYNKYNSLVIEISDFNNNGHRPGSYLSIGNGTYWFNCEEDNEIKINEDGEYVIDLKKYDNDKVLAEISSLQIQANNMSGDATSSTYAYSAIIERIYFSTQKAEDIK